MRAAIEAAASGLRCLAADLGKPEGPVALPDGRWIVTEMERGRITRIDPAGRRRAVLAETPRPNGLAADAAGDLWIAESLDRKLLCRKASGALAAVSGGESALPFLWPNDLCFGPDGWIYLTDSGTTVAEFDPGRGDTAVDGRLFRIDPVSWVTEVLDRGLQFANGLAFGLDGFLYVAETLTGEISRYSLEGGRFGDREAFATVVSDAELRHAELVGPDGIAFDAAGNLLVAVLGRGDITIVSPDGVVVGHVPLPGSFPTNIAFGPPGTRTAAITEGSRGELLAMPWPVDGLALHQPSTR